MYKSDCYTSPYFSRTAIDDDALVLSCVSCPVYIFPCKTLWGWVIGAIDHNPSRFNPLSSQKTLFSQNRATCCRSNWFQNHNPDCLFYFSTMFVWNWGQYGFTNWSCKTDLIELYSHLQKYILSRWNYSQRSSLWIGIDWRWNPPWRDKITSIRDATIPQLGDSPVLSVKNYPSPHLYFSLKLTLHLKWLHPALYTTFNWTLPSGLS